MTRALRILEESQDRTYSARNPLVRRYFWSRLIAMVRSVQSHNLKLILDMGCGRGELLEILAGKFAGAEYVAIDLGKEIYAARKGARANNLQSVHFMRADCRFMPLRSASSQLVFCASVLEHLPDVLPAMLEIARILDSSGKLVVGAPTENALYGMGRRLVGLRKPVDHFHQGVRLEAVIDRKFTRSLSRKLPFSFLPTFLALYLISVYEKSREPIACASDTTPAPHCMPHLSSSPASY